jgi:hypothetical protein
MISNHDYLSLILFDLMNIPLNSLVWEKHIALPFKNVDLLL